MEDLVWDNALSVQIQEIDEDHRRLVDLFNILSRSVREGDAPDYIGAVMEELVNCTAWHFSHEERLMLRYRYEGADEHKREHRELISSARALQQRMEQEGKPLSGEDIEFLEQWLTGHILGADMELGSRLAEVM